ncbi:MAG TPA: hypothetical protein EYN86_02420 [Planctomycetes bacterium]|nr:hypothetical protein [Planctomycetota bacterium]
MNSATILERSYLMPHRTKGSLRIEFKEEQVHYAVMIMLFPDNGNFSQLKVIAAEFGMRGRAELAKALAEEIASSL